MKSAKIVLGVGFGDEGKGSIVDFLSTDADLVIRFNGGCQAAHNVIYDGFHHTFSQFGSGSLRGVPTLLDHNVIIDPNTIISEANHLALKVTDPCRRLYIDDNCLITTVYHRRLNRIEDNLTLHGSCGVGIGPTRRMWSKTGNGLRYRDLKKKGKLIEKLNWIRQWCQDQQPYNSFVQDINEGINFEEEMTRLLESYDFLRKQTLKEREVDSLLKGRILYEGAQGLMLDEVYGTIPHTTYSNTRGTYAFEQCRYVGIKPTVIGVTRTYKTRHGAGPMLSGKLDIKIKDHNIDNGSFAGEFRIGHLNIETLEKYCTIGQIDYLAINHIDEYPEPAGMRVRPVLIEGRGPSGKDKILLDTSLRDGKI